MTDVLLEVRDLRTHVHTRRGVARAVDGASFSVRRGETPECILLDEAVSALDVSDALYAHLLHPYTQILLSNALPGHPDDVREAAVVRGEVPSAFEPPGGCRFHPRCPHALSRCAEAEPPLRERAPGHRVACHLYGD